MFGFGSRLLISSLLNEIFDNIYLLVIGKMFSPADLGFFTRAKSLNELPTFTLSGMVGRVTFPVFSTLQNDPARLKRGLKKAMTSLVLVNSPLMVGMAVVAKPLVSTLLTEKWLPCVPYLQLLCLVGLLFPLSVMNLNVLQAMGRSDLFLRLEIIKKILITIGIAITWRWGIVAMIYGLIVVSLLSYYLNSYYNGVLLGYPIQEQIADLFSYLAAAAVMGLAVYSIGLLWIFSTWIMLVTQVCMGFIVYIGLCRLFRLPAFLEMWQMWSKGGVFLKDETSDK